MSLKIKSFFKQVFILSLKKEILNNSMSLVYTTLLSLVPLFLFSFYIISSFNFFGSSNLLIEKFNDFILENLAVGTADSIIKFINSFLGNIDINKLGFIGFSSLIIVVIFMLARIEVVFNKIWNVKKHRDFIGRFVSFWTFITLGIFLVAFFISFLLSFITQNLGNELINLNINIEKNFFSNIGSLFISYFIFVLAYYFIPNTKVNPKSALLGGIVSGSLFIIAKEIYNLYTKNVVTYDLIYGPLSIIPIFLIWIYIIWIIALFGCVLTYVHQNKGTIAFSNNPKKIKKKYEIFVPASIILVSYDSFQDENSKGLSTIEISEKVNIPYDIILKHLDRLVEKKILAKTNEELYILLKPLEKISLFEVLDTLDFSELDFEDDIVKFEAIQKIKGFINQKLDLKNIYLNEFIND